MGEIGRGARPLRHSALKIRREPLDEKKIYKKFAK
jgi:hypothetical protein